jgi:phage gp45-like
MWDGFPEGPDGVIAGLRRAQLIATDDSGTQQKVNVSGLASEQLTKLVRAMPHGFGSNAPIGSDGILISLGGRSDRALILGLEHKDYRQRNLPVGTAVLYDDKGNIVFVKGANGIAIDAKTGNVYVKPAPGNTLYLGGTGSDGSYSPVVTVAGPSSNVQAKV